jgi:hypothetical protein
MLAPEADVRSPLAVLVTAALLGCSSMSGPGGGTMRLYRTGDLAAVVAGVLDALPAADVALVDARAVDGGRAALVHGRATVRGPQPLTLVLEVAVSPAEGAVRVRVGAEPPEAAAWAEGPIPPGDEAPRRSCACSDPPFPLDPHPRDNLRILSESRKLVRAYLAALDARLR